MEQQVNFINFYYILGIIHNPKLRTFSPDISKFRCLSPFTHFWDRRDKRKPEWKQLNSKDLEI